MEKHTSRHHEEELREDDLTVGEEPAESDGETEQSGDIPRKEDEG